MKRLLVLVAVLVPLSLFITGCGGTGGSSGKTEKTPEQKEQIMKQMQEQTMKKAKMMEKQ